jgi:hypothetical protein
MKVSTEIVRRTRDTAKSHTLYAFTAWAGANVIQTSLCFIPIEIGTVERSLYICTGVQWVLWISFLTAVTRMRRKFEVDFSTEVIRQK